MRREIVLRALAVAACAFAASYAILRCAQAWFYPAQDPLAPVVRVAFFFRCGLAFFAAALASLGGAALADRSTSAFDERIFPWMLTATIAVGALQGIFVP